MKNNSTQSNGWLLKITAIMAFCIMQLAINNAYSQCQAYISVDGNSTSVSGLALPVWLHASQILGMNAAVTSISVIEFAINQTTNDLDFSQVLSVTTTSAVPTGKVWKVESIIKSPLIGNVLSSTTFTASGTFTVPSCTNYICVEVWGAGGGGGDCSGCSSNQGGAGGGGGGGYGTGCFTVTPGGPITVTIGAGGTTGSNGGTTSVGALISATGGSGGGASVGGTGGSGGNSTAYVHIPGTNGVTGNTSGQGGAAGGAGANGGAGGAGGCSPAVGVAPGGGGGGGDNCNGTVNNGKTGAIGQVKISW